MLTVQKQPICAGRPKYFEKIVTLPDGRTALVVFEIVEKNGSLTAKVVCGKILESANILEQQTILALPAYYETENIIPIKSPFYAYIPTFLKDLSFTTCQVTRAPNF